MNVIQFNRSMKLLFLSSGRLSQKIEKQIKDSLKHGEKLNIIEKTCPV